MAIIFLPSHETVVETKSETFQETFKPRSGQVKVIMTVLSYRTI